MNYTIKSGDTLWGIAKRFLGEGTAWPRLWEANADALRAAQVGRKVRGVPCDGPNWIFPGTVIVVPA